MGLSEHRQNREKEETESTAKKGGNGSQYVNRKVSRGREDRGESGGIFLQRGGRYVKKIKMFAKIKVLLHMVFPWPNRCLSGGV